MNSLTLVKDATPQSRIVVATFAALPEHHAAQELQKHIEEISGALLPIETTHDTKGTNILIGRTELTEQLVGGFDWSTLKEDGCLVKTVDNNLVLAGATPRGTLYAVYEFLEEILGCRWLSSSVSHIPKQKSIEISELEIAHTPPFRYREIFGFITEDADWAARNRTNGSHTKLDEKRGGKWTYAGFVHTFHELVPPETYFATHPEFFSEIEGERIRDGVQLCLSNAELVQVVTNNAREWLHKQPDARILSISQNDCWGSCQCANCRAIDEDEGSPSGAMVRFVNAVAENLEIEFPNVFFDTLAYTYSVAPPLHARPRHNVNIRLCHMSPCCDAHGLESCDLNANFLSYLQTWGEISPEVFVWDYFTNFYHYFMPFPNLDAICADLTLFARAGVTGMFCQADGAPTKGEGGFALLRNYLLAKLMWHPERDGKQIIEEFLHLYYGPAAAPIKKYIDLIHAPGRDGSAHFNLYSNLDHAFLAPEVMAHAESLFDEAASLVKNGAILSERVLAARLPVEFIHLKSYNQFVVKDGRLESSSPRELARAEVFFEIAERHGARALKEGGRPLAAEMNALRGFDIVTLEARGLKLVIGPSIGGRIISLVDESGEEWMHKSDIHADYYPVSGGYEEYTEGLWHSPGWCENFSCELEENSARLSAELDNGLRLDRTYRIENDGSLVIESVVLNNSEETKKISMRAHPEIATGAIENCEVRARETDGSWRTLAPWRASENKRAQKQGSLWLQNEEMPDGSWLLARGTRTLEIGFDIKTIEKCLLDWRGADHIVGLELFVQPQTLAPGESLKMVQRWIFRAN